MTALCHISKKIIQTNIRLTNYANEGILSLEFCALGEVVYMYELTDAIILSGCIGFYSVNFEAGDAEASQSIMFLTIGAEYAL